MRSVFIALCMTILTSTVAFANCEIIKDGAKSPFNDEIHNGDVVEKKSLVLLNKLYRNLNVIEKMFKGEVLTCVACSGTYITCKED